MLIVCAFCHYQEEHWSRGLCHRCYEWVCRMGIREAFPCLKRGRGRQTYDAKYHREWRAKRKEQAA